jgi:uncharacterized repeat protein (TIGR02543 family)
MRYAFDIALSALPERYVYQLQVGTCESDFYTLSSPNCIVFGSTAFDVVGIQLDNGNGNGYGLCNNYRYDGATDDPSLWSFTDGPECPTNSAVLLYSAANNSPPESIYYDCTEDDSTCDQYSKSILKQKIDEQYQALRNVSLHNEYENEHTGPTLSQLIIPRSLKGGALAAFGDRHADKASKGPNTPNAYFWPLTVSQYINLPYSNDLAVNGPIVDTTHTVGKNFTDFTPESLVFDNKTGWKGEDYYGIYQNYWLRSRCPSDSYPTEGVAGNVSRFSNEDSSPIEGEVTCINSNGSDYGENRTSARPFALLKTDGQGVSANLKYYMPELSVGACVSISDNYEAIYNASCLAFGDSLWDVVGINDNGVTHGTCTLPAGAFWSQSLSSDAECPNNTVMIALSSVTDDPVIEGAIKYNNGVDDKTYYSSALRGKMDTLYNNLKGSCLSDYSCYQNPKLQDFVVPRELVCQGNAVAVSDLNKCITKGLGDNVPAEEFFAPSVLEVNALSTRSTYSPKPLSSPFEQAQAAVTIKNLRILDGQLEVNLEGGSAGDYALSSVGGCSVAPSAPNGSGENKSTWTLNLGGYATYCAFKFGRKAANGYLEWISPNQISYPTIEVDYQCRIWNYDANVTGTPPDNHTFPANGKAVRWWQIQIPQNQLAPGNGFRTLPIYEDKVGQVENNLCQREGYKQIGWSGYPYYQVDVATQPEWVWPGNSIVTTTVMGSGSWNYGVNPIWEGRPEKLQFYNPYAGPAAVGDLEPVGSCQYSKAFTMPSSVSATGYNFLGWSYTDPGGMDASGSLDKTVDLAGGATTYTCADASGPLLADGSIPVKKLYAVWGTGTQSSLTVREWHYTDQDFTGMHANNVYTNHPQSIRLDFNGGTGTGVYMGGTNETPAICTAGAVTDKTDAGHYGQTTVSLLSNGLCKIKLKRASSPGLLEREDTIEVQVYKISFDLQSWLTTPTWKITKPNDIYFIGTINAGLPSLLDLTDSSYPQNVLVNAQDGMWNKDGMWRDNPDSNNRGSGNYYVQANQYGHGASVTHTFTSNVTLYPDWDSRAVGVVQDDNGSGLITDGESLGTCLYNSMLTRTGGTYFQPSPLKPANANGYIGVGWNTSASAWAPLSGSADQTVVEMSSTNTNTCFGTTPVSYPTSGTPAASKTLYAVYAGQAPPAATGATISTSFTTSDAFAKVSYSVPTTYEGNALQSLDLNFCYADTAEELYVEGSGICEAQEDIDSDDAQPIGEFDISGIQGKYLTAWVRTSNANGKSSWLKTSTVQVNFPTYTATFDAATSRPAGTLLQNVSPSNASGIAWGNTINSYLPSTNPILEGYEFGGWRAGLVANTVYDATNVGTEANCGGTGAAGTVVKADITLHACWLNRAPNVVSFSIGTLPSEATTTASSPQTVNVPHHSELLNDNGISADFVSKTLKASFQGWYTEDACAGSQVTFPHDVAADTNLYACWQAEADISVTYDMNFSELGSAKGLTNGTDKVYRFDTLTAPDAPELNPMVDNDAVPASTVNATFPYNTASSAVLTKVTAKAEGHALAGWSILPDCSTLASTFSLTSNITLYACWNNADIVSLYYSGATYELIDSVPPGTFPEEVYVQVANGTKLTAPTPNPQAVGYSFDHWGLYAYGDPTYGYSVTTVCSRTQQNASSLFDNIRVGSTGGTFSHNALQFTACWNAEAPVTVTFDPGTVLAADSGLSTVGSTDLEFDDIGYGTHYMTDFDNLSFSAEGATQQKQGGKTVWYTEDLCQGTPLTSSSDYYLTSNLTLYACWEQVADSTVTWSANLPTSPTSSGDVASMPSSPTSVVHNTTILPSGDAPSATPTLPGYVFDGWKVGSDSASSAFNFAELKPGNTAINIYASWVLKADISVTFKPNANPASVTNMPSNMTNLTFGNSLDLTSYTPVRQGFHFEGWYTCEVVNGGDDNLCTTTTTTTTYTDPNLKVPASNLVLYAKWDSKEVNIAYVNNDATAMAALLGAAPTMPGNYVISIDGMTFDDNLGVPGAGTYPGYSFDGWYFNAGCSGIAAPGACTTPAKGPDADNPLYMLNYFIAQGLEDGATINIYPKFTAIAYYVQYNTSELNFLYDSGNVNAFGQSMTPASDWGTLASTDHALTAHEANQVAGYIFRGWRINSYSGADNFATVNNSVRFFANCGALSPETQTVLTAASLTCRDSFTMPAGNISFIRDVVARVFSLDIQWNVAGNNHVLNSAVMFDEITQPYMADYLGEPSLLPRPTVDGVSFLGFKTCSIAPTDIGGGNFTCSPANLTGDVPSYMPSYNLMIFAAWTPEYYKIRFADNDRSITSTTNPPLGGWDDAMHGDVLHPTDYLTPLSAPGFTFLGWSTSASCSNLTTPNSCDGNILPQGAPYATLPDLGANGATQTYYAAWAYRELTTTVNINNGVYLGSDAGEVCAQQYRGGTLDVNKIGTPICNSKVAAGVESIQVPNTHKGDMIKLVVTSGGSVELNTLEYNGATGSLDPGTCVDGGGGYPTPCTAWFTIGTNNHTISASFVAQDRTLTVTQPANGGTIVADETHFNDGDLINLRAFPAQGYAFTRWVVTGSLNKTYQNSGTSIHNTNENATDGDGAVLGVNVYGDGDATITAVFTATAQTFNFWDMNGTGTPRAVQSNCLTDAACDLTSAPNLTGEKAGYTFAGYYIGNPTSWSQVYGGYLFCAPSWSALVATCTNTGFTTPNESIQFYASWIPNSGIALSFDLNYPGHPTNPTNVAGLTFEGSLTDKLPATPVRTGYDFLGWRTCLATPPDGEQCQENDKGLLYDASSTAPMVSTKLYAFWHRKAIKVRYSITAAQSAGLTANGVSPVLPGFDGMTSPAGRGFDDARVGDYIAANVPSNHAGYDFLGWYQCVGTPDATDLASATNCTAYAETTAIPDTAQNGDEIFLSANFAIKTLTIHYGNAHGDAGSWSGLHDYSCEFNQECDVLEPSPTGYEGYTFAGWKVNSPTYLAAADQNVYAFDCTVITVDISPSTCFETFPNMPAEDVYLISQRVAIKYSITFDANVESTYSSDVVTGMLSAFQGSTAVSYRDPLPPAILANTPERKVGGIVAYDFTGYQQARDSVSCSDRILTLRETMPAHDMLLCATWQPKAISATFYGADNTTVLRTSANNHFRDEILPENVPATPTKPGYTFAAWNTAPNGAGDDWNVPARSLTTADLGGVSLYPRYTTNTQNVTFALGDCSSATPTWVSGAKTGSAETGADFTWTASRSEISCKGSDFTGYDITGTTAPFNGSHVAPDEEITYTMPSGGFTATATWIERTYDVVVKSQFIEPVSIGEPREVDNPGTVQISIAGTPQDTPATQNTSSFNMGDSYSLEAIPAEGFVFARWRIVTDDTTCDPGETLPTNSVYFTDYSANPTADLTVLACDMTIRAEFNAVGYTFDFDASTTNYTNALGHTFEGLEIELFKNGVLQSLAQGESFAVNAGVTDEFNVLLAPKAGFELLSARVIKDSDSSVLASCDNETEGEECDFESEDPLEFDAVADDMHLEVVVDRINRTIVLSADPTQVDATNGAYFGQVQIGNAQNVYDSLEDTITTTVKAYEVFSINAESYTNANFNTWIVSSQGVIISDSGLCQGDNWETIEACRCEMPNFDVNVEANFTPIHYYLRLAYEDTTYGDPGQDDVGGSVKATITSNWKVGYPAGTVFQTNAAPVQADIYAGKEYDVEATPAQGFVFDHWTTNRVSQSIDICTADSDYYIANHRCPEGANVLTGLVKQPQNTVIRASFKRVDHTGTFTNAGAWDSSDLWGGLPPTTPSPVVVAVSEVESQSITPASTPISFVGFTGEQMVAVAPTVPGYTFQGFEGVYNDGNGDKNVTFNNASYASQDASAQEIATQDTHPQAISIPGANTAQFAFPSVNVTITARYVPIAHNFTADLRSTTGQNAAGAGTLSALPDYSGCDPQVCTEEVEAASTYFAGMPLSISATPNAGWTFDHIIVRDSTTLANTTINTATALFSTENTNYAIFAYFKPVAYRLDYESTRDSLDAAHGYVSVYKMVGDLRLPVHSGDMVEHGTVLSLDAESNAYFSHRFASWTSPTGHLANLHSTTTPSTTFTMPLGNSALVANFDPVLPNIRILEAPSNAASACDTPTLNTLTEVYVGEYLCVRGLDFYDQDPDATPGTPDPYPINIELHSDPIVLGMTTVDEQGRFALPVQVSSAEEAAALNLALDSQHDVVAYSDVFNEGLEESGFGSAFEAAMSVSAAAKVQVLVRSGTRPGPGTPGDSGSTPGGGGDGGGSVLPTPSFPSPGEPVPPGTVIPGDPDNPGGEIGTCSVEAWSKPNCLDNRGEWTPVPPAPPGAPIYADPRDPRGELGSCSVPSYSKSDCVAKGGTWTTISWGHGLVSTGIAVSWALFLMGILVALGVWFRRRKMLADE